ncbi:hypothetical protein LXL04_024151 [Taraxacum kok-saghyz]
MPKRRWPGIFKPVSHDPTIHQTAPIPPHIALLPQMHRLLPRSTSLSLLPSLTFASATTASHIYRNVPYAGSACPRILINSTPIHSSAALRLRYHHFTANFFKPALTPSLSRCMTLKRKAQMASTNHNSSPYHNSSLILQVIYSLDPREPDTQKSNK